MECASFVTESLEVPNQEGNQNESFQGLHRDNPFVWLRIVDAKRCMPKATWWHLY